MTADDIIGCYEEAWRAMDIAGVAQFYGVAAGGIPGGFEPWATCAWVARPTEWRLTNVAQMIRAPWRCTVEPDCTYRAGALSHAIMHVNNRHHMTFGWFAKHFRDVWQRGIAT